MQFIGGFLCMTLGSLLTVIAIAMLTDPQPAVITVAPQHGLRVGLAEVNRICNARQRMEKVKKQ